MIYLLIWQDGGLQDYYLIASINPDTIKHLQEVLEKEFDKIRENWRDWTGGFRTEEFDMECLDNKTFEEIKDYLKK